VSGINSAILSKYGKISIILEKCGIFFKKTNRVSNTVSNQNPDANLANTTLVNRFCDICKILYYKPLSHIAKIVDQS
jgi:hypothetical protein